MTSNILE